MEVSKISSSVRTIHQSFSTAASGRPMALAVSPKMFRFSEDIDLALDRAFLGYTKSDEEMTSSQVRKLRENSLQFITQKYFPELNHKFKSAGFEDVNLKLPQAKYHDQDPLTTEIYYPALTDPIPYLQPRVLIELGSRSLIEPFSHRSITSMVGGHFKGRSFADENVTIPCVNPERTFLEKIFLLHEEFQQPFEKMRIDRKSRHLYDLEKLMDTEYGKAALADKSLYQTIVTHRRTITPLRGIDYANHSPDKINPVPPDKVIAEWEKDYVAMQESMLYNPSLSFEQLINRVRELTKRINKL